MVQPPDIARCELRVTPETRLWRGELPASLQELVVGDLLLVNLTAELPESPARCTEIWIGTETHKLATEQQAKKHAPAKK
jgi:hypothetical protein